MSEISERYRRVAEGMTQRVVAVPESAHRMLSGIEPYDDMLRASGQYGQRVMVPDDADEQARLIAFMGREP